MNQDMRKPQYLLGFFLARKVGFEAYYAQIDRVSVFNAYKAYNTKR